MAEQRVPWQRVAEAARRVANGTEGEGAKFESQSRISDLEPWNSDFSENFAQILFYGSGTARGPQPGAVPGNPVAELGPLAGRLQSPTRYTRRLI